MEETVVLCIAVVYALYDLSPNNLFIWFHLTLELQLRMLPSSPQSQLFSFINYLFGFNDIVNNSYHLLSIYYVQISHALRLYSEVATVIPIWQP